MNIKKMVVTSVVAGVALAGASAPAFANSPHFVNASASLDTSHQLVVSFKEAGLGNEVTNITASASATALWGCINSGQNHPQARNKESASGLVSTSQDFTPRNGNISGSLVVSPPGPSAGFTCPDDMVVALLQASYSNITVTDNTHGISSGVPGTLTYTNKDVRF